jgi:hypothetical protein
VGNVFKKGDPIVMDTLSETCHNKTISPPPSQGFVSKIESCKTAFDFGFPSIIDSTKPVVSVRKKLIVTFKSQPKKLYQSQSWKQNGSKMERKAFSSKTEKSQSWKQERKSTTSKIEKSQIWKGFQRSNISDISNK